MINNREMDTLRLQLSESSPFPTTSSNKSDARPSSVPTYCAQVIKVAALSAALTVARPCAAYRIGPPAIGRRTGC
jgi:hypothetical protein